MVERDGIIVYQQNSKEHETKNQIHNYQKIISLEAKKLIRTIESSFQKTNFTILNKSCNNKENNKLENSKGRQLQDQIMTKTKEKEGDYNR